jgi:Pretoxin HINT domain
VRGLKGGTARAADEPSPAAETKGPKCDSFDLATPVLLADGTTKPIGTIQIGDSVKATDPATKNDTAQQVTVLHDNLDTDLAEVTVATVGQQSLVHTTQHHPFWDVTTQQWTLAADLRPGDLLYTTGGATAAIVAVRSFTGSHEMRNLTVANTHTYYVIAGTTPVLVHNCGGDVPNPYGKKGGPAHQQGVNDVVADLEGQGYTVRTEVPFETPGGFKPTRYADAVAYDSEGNMVSVHQVGRQTGLGIPVMRETKAMSDIWSVLPDGVDVVFHPYN